MNIEPIQNGRIRVWLTEEELQQWSLSDPTPDRRQVRRLVARVLRRAGCRYEGVDAELIPVMGGGVLLVSPCLYPEAGRPIVYRLEADALLSLWERWPREAAATCILYEVGEEYRLAVYPEEPLTPRQMHLLLEYGTPLAGGEGAAAQAAEYGTPVAMGQLLTADERRPPASSDPGN